MSKQKAGISRLLSAMKKNIREVNDQEICRRLEILMYSEKEDISAQLIKRVMDSTHYDLEPKEIPEPYTQYVKHYFYMLKRENRIKDKESNLNSANRAGAGKKIIKKIEKKVAPQTVKDSEVLAEKKAKEKTRAKKSPAASSKKTAAKKKSAVKKKLSKK